MAEKSFPALSSPARVALAALVCTVFLYGSNASESHSSSWKTFRNRDGWSILYPAQWTIRSCHACPDPTDSGVYAVFTPPKSTPSITVSVYPDDRYMDLARDARFRELETRLRPANVKQLRVTDFVLNGLPARTILYQSDAGSTYQSELTIIAAPNRSYEIIVFPAGTDAPLANQSLYRDHVVRMRDSFRIDSSPSRN